MKAPDIIWKFCTFSTFSPHHPANSTRITTCVYTPAGQQFEELKKAKEDIAEECVREKSAHKTYKRECSALKAEYNILRLKV